MPYWVAICNSATSARGAAVDSGDNKIIAAKAAQAKPTFISHLTLNFFDLQSPHSTRRL
jgi:hypothetical protein